MLNSESTDINDFFTDINDDFEPPGYIPVESQGMIWFSLAVALGAGLAYFLNWG